MVCDNFAFCKFKFLCLVFEILRPKNDGYFKFIDFCKKMNKKMLEDKENE